MRRAHFETQGGPAFDGVFALRTNVPMKSRRKLIAAARAARGVVVEEEEV